MFCESSAKIVAFIPFGGEADESGLSLHACLNRLTFGANVVLTGSDSDLHVCVRPFHRPNPFAIKADPNRNFPRIERESPFGDFYDV